MSTDASAGEPVKKTGPIYTFLEGDMMINAPVEKVWPHVINYTSWQKFSRVDHVSGVKGQEGEVKFMMKDEPGFKTTPYYSRLLKLEPNRRVTWKTYRDNSNYFGIVEFRVEEVGGKTKFTWRMMYEHEVSYTTEDELRELQRNQQANFSTLASNIYPKLRELVEKAG